MPELPSSFNSEEHGDMGFEAIPRGDYVAHIVESDIKPTKDAIAERGGNADLPIEQYSAYRYVFTWKVLTGDYEGRTLFSGLNMKNPSKQTVEIANKEFATILRACGKVTVKSTEQLHMIPCVLTVGVKPATAQYDEQNVIKNYKSYSGAAVSGSGGKSASKPKNPGGETTSKAKPKPTAEAKGGGGQKPVWDD